MARACGSYPQCRGFKSLLRYFHSLARWSSGQDATLSRSNQGFDSLTGQVLRENFIVKTWEFSSAGRASALQAEGHRFEPCNSHFFMSKNRKQERKLGERHSRGESCTNVQEVTRLCPVTPIFLCPKTENKRENWEKGTAEESHARTCKRSQGCAL